MMRKRRTLLYLSIVTLNLDLSTQRYHKVLTYTRKTLPARPAKSPSSSRTQKTASSPGSSSTTSTSSWNVLTYLHASTAQPSTKSSTTSAGPSPASIRTWKECPRWNSSSPRISSMPATTTTPPCRPNFTASLVTIS